MPRERGITFDGELENDASGSDFSAEEQTS
jgi:hypothetical protein